MRLSIFQFEVDLMASRLAGSPLATSEPLSENASSKSSGVFGMQRWHHEDLSVTRVSGLEVSSRYQLFLLSTYDCALPT